MDSLPLVCFFFGLAFRIASHQATALKQTASMAFMFMSLNRLGQFYELSSVVLGFSSSLSLAAKLNDSVAKLSLTRAHTHRRTNGQLKIII